MSATYFSQLTNEITKTRQSLGDIICKVQDYRKTLQLFILADNSIL